MSVLSNFLSTSLATVAQALLGLSNTALMTPATTAYTVPRKNFIINGAMMISQQFGTTATTTNGTYPVDQFTIGTNSGVVSAAQVVAPTPGGSPNRFRVTVTTADTVIDSTNINWIDTRLEGLLIT